jgi:hypothetical protein
MQVNVAVKTCASNSTLTSACTVGEASSLNDTHQPAVVAAQAVKAGELLAAIPVSLAYPVAGL